MDKSTFSPEAFLTEKDLAARWRCSSQWLRNCRSAGTGVTPTYFGRSVRYALADVEAHEQERRGFAS